MNQINFGNYKSYDDLYLICNKKTVGSPTPKTNTISIEGGDGVLDFTEFFGDVKYNNRILNFELTSMVHPSDFPELYSRLLDLLNGQKMKIVLDEDSDFYYIGRLTVSDPYKEANVIDKINITADCEPYKYKINDTVVTQAVSGTSVITLSNMCKRTVPSITSDATFTITFGGKSATVGAGTFTIPELELVAGDNEVTVSGNGNITFTYKEGGL